VTRDVAPALDIVHVVRSDSFAGVERYICGVANGLAERGHRVQVVGGEHERMARELFAEVRHISASSLAQSCAALRRVGLVDIAHAHMTAGETAAVAGRLWHRGSVVATRHFPERRGTSLLARLAAPIIRRALSEQVSISRFVANGISEPSIVVYNGVPSRDSAPLSARRVLMMQRLESEKAPVVGVRAWARSRLAEQGWTLDIAGSGRLEPLVRRACDELGVTESVRFLGRVGDTDAVLRGSSVLLAPAPREPFGLAVAEAMAHGIPVAAAAGGAHLETLGQDGCFFAAGDADGAADQLRRLGDDDLLRREVGSRLQRRQRRLFSLERHVERLEQLYRWILT
jgi:glycosyltransferase involved in cell wall biosynthesis